MRPWALLEFQDEEAVVPVARRLLNDENVEVRDSANFVLFQRRLAPTPFLSKPDPRQPPPAEE
jgi:HEAT repeat protein